MHLHLVLVLELRRAEVRALREQRRRARRRRGGGQRRRQQARRRRLLLSKLMRASFCQVAPRNFRRLPRDARGLSEAVRQRRLAADRRAQKQDGGSAATSSTRWRQTLSPLSPPAARLRLRKFTALSACANPSPPRWKTTIIGYGVLLAVLLFAACGYYCWSEARSAMVAEALRVAAERRKGTAVAPAGGRGTRRRQPARRRKAGRASGSSRAAAAKEEPMGRRRPSPEPIDGSSDDDVERGQPRRGAEERPPARAPG